MTPEIEAAAIDSTSALGSGRGHPKRSGLPCLNCGEVVEDRFCTSCGQLATDFHRPWWDLVATSLGDTFLFDSRLARTIPLLLFKPGRLTRNYLDGQRSRYVPPFRMLLLTSVLFFLAVFGLSDRMGWFQEWKVNFSPSGDFYLGPETDADWSQKNIERAEEGLVRAEAARSKAQASAGLTSSDLADLEADIADAKSDLEDAKKDQKDVEAVQSTLQTVIGPDGKIDRAALRQSIVESAGPDATPGSIDQQYQIASRAADVYENQDRFGARMREWAPRFSLFLFPILTLLLCIAYAWRRHFFVFDHLVTALHFQTFMYGLATVNLLIAAFVPAILGWAASISALILFVYLYRQLRVTYGSGHVQSFLRALFLSFAGLTALSSLAVGLVVLSFLTT